MTASYAASTPAAHSVTSRLPVTITASMTVYHSVPVDKNRRFFVVYVNGIVIYLVTTLLNILISVIMAMV